MQQIGEAAGVARSTPAYFFRSKDALYEEVLARAVARAERELASAHGEGRDRSPEEAVTSYVHALVDLLSRDQNLVRLIQRESLRNGTRVAEFLRRLETTPSPSSHRPRGRRESRHSKLCSTHSHSPGIHSRTRTRFRLHSD